MLEQRHGLLADELQAAAQTALDAWADRGIQTLGYRQHPPGIADMRQPPPLLWLTGELRGEDHRGVAVIGTRRPTEQAIALTEAIAAVLVRHDITVISGLAAGVDTAAHTAALHRGGRTVAVLGTGHDHPYPAANRALQQAVQAAVSPFAPDRSPTRQTFPRRNAVMSALSRATVIVEAGEHSGARIQARHAIEQGRPLVLMRGVLDHAWARTLATQAGVRVVASAQELIDAL